MLDITSYFVSAPALDRTYRLALVTDLHNCAWKQLWEGICRCEPDAVVIAGDLMGNMEHRGARSMQFLRTAAQKYPVFYGFGNHECCLSEDDRGRIRETGAHLLINAWAPLGALTIGGIAPDSFETRGGWDDTHTRFLEDFSKTDGYRVLLCHRPEWYFAMVQPLAIPLTLSGHAHGGQVRFLGRPVYSPGQGLFPKYAQGMHENRLIVSRGLGNHTIVPRFFNAPELCIIDIGQAPRTTEKRDQLWQPN